MATFINLFCLYLQNHKPLERMNKRVKETKDLNRIKLVLVEKKRTNRWLAEQLGKDEATTSKWCTNSLQPNLETLIRIAELLEVEVQELIRTNK